MPMRRKRVTGGEAVSDSLCDYWDMATRNLKQEVHVCAYAQQEQAHKAYHANTGKIDNQGTEQGPRTLSETPRSPTGISPGYRIHYSIDRESR